MPCRYFVPEPMCRCAAVHGAVVPSIYERERFCRSEQGFVRCPTFRAQARRGSQLAERDYYALWIGADGEPPQSTDEPSRELHPR
jgi:hypothetical protein